MITVAVIGAGDIGGATAHALATSDAVGRILLVDSSAKVAAGKALDMQQAGAVDGFHTRLEGTDDFTRATGCALAIVADRFAGAEWAGDDGLAMLARLAPALSGAPIVFAGSDQALLLDLASRELGVRRSRLIGSAPEAFASAVRSMVALEADCSPSEVSLSVLGRPPRGIVVPWNDAAIGGHRLDQRLEPVKLTRIEARVDRLWPPGPYALGLAAASVAEAIVTSARRSRSILTVLDGEFGVRRAVGIVPAMLSSGGIAATRSPMLTTKESVKLLSALGDGAAGAR